MEFIQKSGLPAFFAGFEVASALSGHVRFCIDLEPEKTYADVMSLESFILPKAYDVSF